MATRKIKFEGKEVETIDITPTWEGILPYYLTVIRDGNLQGVKIATEELQRMARLADAYVKLMKESEDKTS